VSAAILDILKQQAVDDRFPCLLPFETEMAHKTGNLDHVVHDAGIIWTPDGPVILVAMVENAEDDAIASQVIQQLALIAYHDLDEPALANEVTPDPTCGA
jgi:beta-lactamase class A